jgi:hygromycin-B 7''-O-kinase
MAVMGRDGLLPPVATLDGYRRLHGLPEIWAPAVDAICRRHGLPAGSHQITRVGSHVVALHPGESVVKLYCPLFPGDHPVERRLLAHLRSGEVIPVPQIRLEGELEGWPYLILSFLEGQPLEELWQDLSEPVQARVGRHLGQGLARWHSIAVPELGDLQPAWESFVRARLVDAVDRQRAHGWGEEWLRQIPDLLEQVELPHLLPARPLLLHADLTGEHLLMIPGEHGPRVAGIIDWADGMTGHGEYDLVALCLDAVQAHGPAQRQLLLGYGMPAAALDQGMREHLLRWTLLHRYVSVPEVVRALKLRPARPTLAALARALFPLE